MPRILFFLIFLLSLTFQAISQNPIENKRIEGNQKMVRQIKTIEKQNKKQIRWNWINPARNTSAAALKPKRFHEWEMLGPNSRPQKRINKTIGQGRICSLWIDPSNFDHLIAGASTSGLWETRNGGKDWKCITTGYATGGVWGFAVDHNNQSTIFITTKTRPNGTLKWKDGYSQGIFKTIDGGINWTKLTIEYDRDEYFERILIHPTQKTILFACSNKKVFRSEDRGQSWSSIFQITGKAQLRDLLFKPNDPSTIYVSGDNALYSSSNEGASWTNIKNSLNQVFENTRIAIAVNKNKPEELYAFYSDLSNSNWYSTPNRIEKSTDGGIKWELINSSNLSGMAHTQEIEISPQNFIFAGGIALHKSINAGQSFKPLTNNYIHSDFHAIHFPDPTNPLLVYVTTDGGIFKSENGGDNWLCINGNLSANEFYSIAISEQNPEVMIGGTHDCGTYYRNETGKWEYVYGGDGGTSLIDPSNYNSFYLTCNRNLKYFKNNKHNRSIANLHQLNSSVAMNPIDPATIFFQEERKPRISGKANFLLSKYTINGTSSTKMILDEAWDKTQAIGVSFSDPNYIYYSTGSIWSATKLRASNDGGMNWNDVNYEEFDSIRSKTYINDICIHPASPKKLWIVMGGFEEGQKVYFSKNRGNSWKNISGDNLPNVPVQCINYDFFNYRLYLGTDAGLYYKSVSDKEWTYAKGFPKVMVSSIRINKKNGDLVVSTYGSGIWRTNLLSID